MTPEEYAQSHKKAFRIAFDFLNTHFPPGDTDEWWEKTGREFGEVDTSECSGILATELLIGIMNYIGDEYKRRKMPNG